MSVWKVVSRSSLVFDLLADDDEALASTKDEAYGLVKRQIMPIFLFKIS